MNAIGPESEMVNSGAEGAIIPFPYIQKENKMANEIGVTFIICTNSASECTKIKQNFSI